MRSALVVLQVCGSLVLLIVAGLFARSLRHVQNAYMGFEPDRVLNVILDPSYAGHDGSRTRTFYHDLSERLSALPGVESVSQSTRSRSASPTWVRRERRGACGCRPYAPSSASNAKRR